MMSSPRGARPQGDEVARARLSLIQAARYYSHMRDEYLGSLTNRSEIDLATSEAELLDAALDFAVSKGMGTAATGSQGRTQRFKR